MIWIAKCVLQDLEGSNRRYHKQNVAVLADGEGEAKSLIGLYYNVAPFVLVKIKLCLPVEAYLEANGSEAGIEALYAQVHDGNRLEFGEALPISPVQRKTTTFRDVLMRYGVPRVAPLFAVLDGAQFENLPVAMFDGRFAARPLYKASQPRHDTHIITAPHLVALNERARTPDGRSFEETLDALMALLDGKPAAVFWQCPEGFDALYHHLRTIGMIMIPTGEVPGVEAEARVAEGQSHSMVIFRHGDANVMAQVAFSVTERESARLFGPASAVLFESEPEWSDGRGWFHIPREAHWPDPQPGPLHLGQNTMDRMTGQRETRFIARLRAYLFKVVPDKMAYLTPHERDKTIRTYVAQGRKLGLNAEAAFGRWCYMQFMLGGKLHETPDVRKCFGVRDVPPDQAVKELLQHTIEVAKQHGM